MGHTTGAQRRTNSILNLSPASPTVGELSSVTAGEGSGGVSTTRDQDAAVARLEAQLRRMGTELTAVKTQLRELTPPVHDPASAKSDEAQPVDEWVALAHRLRRHRKAALIIHKRQKNTQFLGFLGFFWFLGVIQPRNEDVVLARPSEIQHADKWMWSRWYLCSRCVRSTASTLERPKR